MALKSKEWFFKQCLREVKNFTPLTHLCWDILEKGIGQRDSTRGHVTQAIGAIQEFLKAQRQWIAVIQRADPTKPLEITSHRQLIRAWKSWFHTKAGSYGRQSFGYNYDTLRHILTPALGGSPKGGGGGDDEFKRVLRLLAAFWARS
jgi:hypothetical protein